MPQQLSGLDATFLYLETPETPMHVGSLNLYALPPDFKGDFTAALRRHIAKRMHLAPLFSNKLGLMPLDIGHPVWLHEPKVDLQYHIRKLTLPRPGTQQQLEAACAQLHAQLIDRSKPLWQFVVIEGVRAPRGEHWVGFYAKIHHAALDGKGGVALANAILDITPVPREVPPPKRSGPAKPTQLKIGEMIGAVLSNSLAQYAKIARALPSAAGALSQAVAGVGVGGLKSALGQPKLPAVLAPKTPFNAPVTATRVFATATLPQAPLRAAARAAGERLGGGGSLNDAVLFVCSTALRSYLQHHQALPRKTLVAAMPVSLREENNQDLNNQASMTLVELGTQWADPARRFAAIAASTAKVKSALAGLKHVLPTDYPSLFAPWLMGGLNAAYTRLSASERMPALANVVISNVPGPAVPLYMAGARMLTYHPLSIVVHGVALNITVQSYAGRVDFGLVACGKAVPDVQLLARGIEAALAQLQALGEPAPAKARAKKAAAPSGQAAGDAVVREGKAPRAARKPATAAPGAAKSSRIRAARQPKRAASAPPARKRSRNATPMQ
ncbi:MAG: wax ester/triacylglycerol synthase family O-acyltransferase [Betaproteobacteria bacterium]|nr:wax ester/triacylglycerol synthase family O-acyltransferase [Betaproteobacteria bacterium]